MTKWNFKPRDDVEGIERILQELAEATADEALRQKYLLLLDSAYRLHEAAEANQVTGLPGQPARDAHVEEVQRRRNYEREMKPYIVMTDIDHFKEVNDKRGHPEGDRALCFVMEIMHRLSRANDRSFHLHGEEGEAIIWAPSKEAAMTVAERYRSGIEEASEKTLGYKVTASLGVTEWYRDEEFSAAEKRADQGIYQSKQSGRNQVFFVERRNLEARI